MSMKIIQSEMNPFKKSLKATHMLPEPDRNAHAELDRRLRHRQLENSELLHNKFAVDLKQKIDKNLDEIQGFKSRLLPVEGGGGMMAHRESKINLRGVRVGDSEADAEALKGGVNIVGNMGISNNRKNINNGANHHGNANTHSSKTNQVNSNFNSVNNHANQQSNFNWNLNGTGVSEKRNMASDYRAPARMKVESGLMNGIPLSQSKMKGQVTGRTANPQVQQLADDYLNSLFSGTNVVKDNAPQSIPPNISSRANQPQFANKTSQNPKKLSNSGIPNINPNKTTGKNDINKAAETLADKTLIKQVLSGVGMSHLAYGYYREENILFKQPEQMGHELFESIKVGQKLRKFERKTQVQRQQQDMRYARATGNMPNGTRGMNGTMNDMMLSTRFDAIINNKNIQNSQIAGDPEVKSMFAANSGPLPKKEMLQETLNLEGHRTMPMRSPQFLTYGEQVDSYLDSILGKGKMKADSIFFEKSVVKAPVRKATKEVFGLLESLKQTFELGNKQANQSSELFGKGRLDFGWVSGVVERFWDTEFWICRIYFVLDTV